MIQSSLGSLTILGDPGDLQAGPGRGGSELRMRSARRLRLVWAHGAESWGSSRRLILQEDWAVGLGK